MCSIVVNEILYSIQGESTHAGRPCVFVRLTGCNLRCSYCDTRYAYKDGLKMEIERIIDAVGAYGCSLVQITGGEPLVQAETPDLVFRLLERRYEVLLETNGSRDISSVDDRCMKIVDFKLPSSGMSDRNDLENIARLLVGVDRNIPFTILAFFPEYQMKNYKPPTVRQMVKAYQKTITAGLNNIRLGNLGVFVKSEADQRYLTENVDPSAF